MNVYASKTLLKTAILLKGKAVVKLPKLAVGKHKIWADFVASSTAKSTTV